MSHASDDKNYTDASQSGANAPAERVVGGDLTWQPPTNESTDRDKASKMANLPEDMLFPATKAEIKSRVNRKSPAMGNRVNKVMEAVINNLQDGVSYSNAYDVEKAAGLVRKVSEA